MWLDNKVSAIHVWKLIQSTAKIKIKLVKLRAREKMQRVSRSDKVGRAQSLIFHMIPQDSPGVIPGI